MTNLVPVTDMKSMATSIVKSGFYGFKSEDQVMAIMAVAQAEGKHPASVVQEYDVIQGRPALKSQAILARFQMAGGKVEYGTYTDDKVEMTFSHPAGGSLTLSWTMKQASKRSPSLIRYLLVSSLSVPTASLPHSNTVKRNDFS